MSLNTSSRFAAVARAQSPEPSLSLPAALGEQLATLYRLAENSAHVFGSPLGPFYQAGRLYSLPCFVYFGPHTSEVSPRMAFLAGLDSRDLRPTLALLGLVEELASRPDIGQSLHLSFYPLVDVLGQHHHIGDRNLARQSWASPASPEIDLLARDAKQRQYHAFVRIESAPADDTITLRLHAADGLVAGLPLLSSEDAEPFPIRIETETDEGEGEVGPGSLHSDLPFRPLELTIRVPADWPPACYREAVAHILKRFIIRYRGHLAYGQNL